MQFAEADGFKVTLKCTDAQAVNHDLASLWQKLWCSGSSRCISDVCESCERTILMAFPPRRRITMESFLPYPSLQVSGFVIMCDGAVFPITAAEEIAKGPVHT